MEVVDLSSITDEDQLRKMWQLTEDFTRKKEIRAYMYKLREQRLKDFYASNDSSPPYFLMDNASTTFGLKKRTVTAIHGDSLVDQSFESFKTKEIRDSESPTRFNLVPSTVASSANSGWQIKTSEEVSNNGKTHIVYNSANTQGTKELEGGGSRTAFAGHNLKSHSEHFDGDDFNFVHRREDQSSTVLVEDSVIKSPKDSCQMGLTHSTTTTSSTSSTRMVRQQQTDEAPELSFDSRDDSQVHSVTNSSNDTVNTQATRKEVSKDPKRVREAFRLAQGAGTEETMVDATTKMITETKRLEDGTTVTTQTYEKLPVVDEQVREVRSKTMLTHYVQDENLASVEGRPSINRITDVSETFGPQNQQQQQQQHQQQQQQQQRFSSRLSNASSSTTLVASQRISVEVDAAHDSFTRSLRSTSPSGSVRSVCSNATLIGRRTSVSPDKGAVGTRCNPSHEANSRPEYMRSTFTSERKASGFCEQDPLTRLPSPRKSSTDTPNESHGPSLVKKQLETTPSKIKTTSTITSSITNCDKQEIDGGRMCGSTKLPLVRSETYEERCRKILGMPQEGKLDVKNAIGNIFSTHDNTETSQQKQTCIRAELREQRKKIEQEIKSIDCEALKSNTGRRASDFIADERDNIQEEQTNVTVQNLEMLLDETLLEKQVSFTKKQSEKDVSSVRKSLEKEFPPSRKSKAKELSSASRLSEKEVSPEGKQSNKEHSTVPKQVETEVLQAKQLSEKGISSVRKVLEKETSLERITTTTAAHSIQSPVEKDLSPSRKPSVKDDAPTRKPLTQESSLTENSIVKEIYPSRKLIVKEVSPTRKQSEKEVSSVKKTSLNYASLPNKRLDKDVSSMSKSPGKDGLLTRKPSLKASPTRKDREDSSPKNDAPSNEFMQTKNARTNSKATVLMEQRREGRNISVAEITIVPMMEVSEVHSSSTKNSSRILIKQSSDTKFDRRSATTTATAVSGGRAITGKSSSDFDVKRRGVDVTAGQCKKRTPHTSPDKRRADSVKSSQTRQNHITVAKIKIDPLRKPEGRQNQEWSGSHSSRSQTTRRLVEPETDPESSKDTGISDNSEGEDPMIDDVVKVNVTGTSCCRHAGALTIADRKDSAPVMRTSSLVRSAKSYARSSSDNQLRAMYVSRSMGTAPTRPTAASANQGRDKPERPVKHVATKTINLSTKVVGNDTNSTTITTTATTFDSDHLDNVVIDIQQAKSSRETTPNKLVPMPVSPDTEDTGRPRYPDAVQEPDEERASTASRPRVSNIAIFEEATNECVGCEITEVEELQEAAVGSSSLQQHATRITSLDRVTEDDESLLSVTEKVTKFVYEASRLQEPAGAKAGSRLTEPTRFVVRHEYDDIDEHLKSDECLLSVSDKVTRFISTAEEVKKIHTSVPFVPETSDSGEIDAQASVTEDDDCLLSVNEKVSRFANRIGEKRSSEEKGEPDEKPCPVSHQVSRFAPQKSPELVKNAMRSTSRHAVDSNTEKLAGVGRTAGLSNITERYCTATVTKPIPATIPPSNSITLRSTEAVKKAKEIFEKGQAGQDTHQRDILSRPSIWDERRGRKATDVKLTDIGVYRKQSAGQLDVDGKRQSESETQPKSEPGSEWVKMMEPGKLEVVTGRRDSGSGARAPAYIRDTVSSKKDLFEKRISSSRIQVEHSSQTSQEGTEHSAVSSRRPSLKQSEPMSSRPAPVVDQSKPSYMNHTVASFEHINANQRRESLDQSALQEQIPVGRSASVASGGSKFGVEMKRLETGSRVTASSPVAPVTTSSVQPNRKSSGAGAGAVLGAGEVVIEEIFELEVLERMLEAATGYEQRRHIRAQIRLVKKQRDEQQFGASGILTSNNSTSTKSVTIAATKRKGASPTRTPVATRKTSTTFADSTDGANSKKQTSTTKVATTTELKSTVESNETPKQLTHPVGNISSTKTETTRMDRFAVKKGPSTKDERPIWATSKILKKASENTHSIGTVSTKANTTSSSAGASSSVKKTVNTLASYQEKTGEPKSITDCITSSYGVGPMDENGLPLFGIRALKKKSTPVAQHPSQEDMDASSSRQISGTIVTESMYTENGRQAVGHSSTMHYTTDPTEASGLSAFTSVEAVGEVMDGSTRTAKVVRKSSVKELTERFVHRESSSSVQQMQDSRIFPKAGLVLRSRADSHSSRASSPATDGSSVRSGSVVEGELEHEPEVEIRRTEVSSSHQVRSFLNDSSKVTDVQDVLNRMSNADNVQEEGDTAEDREARALLNKFLGASVLMSGVESLVSQPAIAQKKVSQKASKVSSTATKTHTDKSTISSSSTQVAPTRKTATVNNLEEVWDEAVLKQLLEASTSYDDRRKIRARIRQIMTEKEACADIVAIVTADLQREHHLQQQSTVAAADSVPGVVPTAMYTNSLPQGESLLLPLLQGLLLSSAVSLDYNRGVADVEGLAGGISGPGDKANGSGGTGSGSSGSGSVSSSVSGNIPQVTLKPPVEDSGTESGEDLRLLAAAAEAADNGHATGTTAVGLTGILHEVTAALERLQKTLRGDSVGAGCAEVMQLDAEKRSALLTLVRRLQQGLLQPGKIAEQTTQAVEGVVKVEDYNSTRRPPMVVQRPSGDGEDDGGDRSPNCNLDESQTRPRASGGSSRFGSKRRINRNSRHTVGVSREELADARRFIEEMVMMDCRQSPSEKAPAPEKTYLLQKQHSLAAVLGSGSETSGAPLTATATTAIDITKAVPAPPATKSTKTQLAFPAAVFVMKRPSQFVPKEMQNTHNSLDKMNLPGVKGMVPITATPTPPARTKSSKEKLLLSRQSLSVDQAVPISTGGGVRQDAKPIDEHTKHNPNATRASLQSATSTDLPFRKPTQTATQRALVKKYSFNDGSSSDDEENRPALRKLDELKKTAEQTVLCNKITSVIGANEQKGGGAPLEINTVQKIVSREKKPDSDAAKEPTSTAGRASFRPIASQGQGLHPSHHRNRTPEALTKADESPAKPVNKFTSKKLRMKRANTIDIPKNLLPSGNSDEKHDDGDDEDADKKQGNGKNRNAPAAGTRSSVDKLPPTGVPPVEVPDFKPRTENDLKFIAFLQRQNQQPRHMWSNPVREHMGGNNWTNKFDHLKSNFEQAGERRGRSELPPKYGATKPSAMSFWRQSESGSVNDGRTAPPSANAAFTKGAQAPVPKITHVHAAAPFAQTLLGKTSGSPVVEGKLVLPKTTEGSAVIQFSHASGSAFKAIPKRLTSSSGGPLEFKPIRQDPDIVKPIPARVSNATGLVKQIVATGFKKTPDERPEPMHVQLGLVRSLAAQGYQETPYVPLPKLERTPTRNVLNYRSRPDAAGSVDPAPPAPWVGKRASDPGTANRVASIAATKFTANPFGHSKQMQPSLTYQGSLKYAERPLVFQQASNGMAPYEKRPSLPDVSTAYLGTYTFTDYTQPTFVSTFTLNRSDSLTNPDNAPLVLTSSNSVFSPTMAANDPSPKPPAQINYLAVNVDQQSSSSYSPLNADDDDLDLDDGQDGIGGGASGGGGGSFSGGYDDDDLDSLDSQEMRVVSKVMQAPQGQQATYSAAQRPTHLQHAAPAEQDSLIAQNLHSSLKKIKENSPTPPKMACIPTSQPSLVAATAPVSTVPAHAIYNNVLARIKSNHNLSVPCGPAGGQSLRPISSSKQRTVEAYFATQPGINQNHQSLGYPMVRTASNHNLVMRDKSSFAGPHTAIRPVSYAMGHNAGIYNVGQVYAHQKPAGFQQLKQPSSCYQPYKTLLPPPPSPPVGGGLLRSRTMPHIPLGSLALLDENNVEDAFEELMSQAFAV